MEEQKVNCPLVEDDITPVECMENRDISEEFIPEIFKKKNDWQEICRKCKYFNC